MRSRKGNPASRRKFAIVGRIARKWEKREAGRYPNDVLARRRRCGCFAARSTMVNSLAATAKHRAQIHESGHNSRKSSICCAARKALHLGS
jgi:hypothetical protein